MAGFLKPAIHKELKHQYQNMYLAAVEQYGSETVQRQPDCKKFSQCSHFVVIAEPSRISCFYGIGAVAMFTGAWCTQECQE